MKIVTGGLGFIGNELVRQLLPLGDVAVVDNRNRVAPRIGDLPSSLVHEADITDADSLKLLFRKLKPDTVYHLAAIHFIPECNANPRRTLRINVEGSQSVFEAAASSGAKHVVLASSGAVYADSPQPLKEDSRVEPVDVYGLSKLFAEQIGRLWAAETGNRLTIARIFNNYGPRETNAHIVPEILQQLQSSSLLRLGNTKPRRDYVHTRDCARFLIELAKRDFSGVTLVNVARGESASVEELIKIMAELLERNIEVQTDPTRFRRADKQIQIADTTLLRKLTGCSPLVTLRDGLRDLLAFEGFIK